MTPNQQLLEDLRNTPSVQASLEQITNDFKAVFPNGYINVRVQKTIGAPYLSVVLGLIGAEGVENGIRENDPLHTSLMGHNVSVDGKVEMETLQSGLNCEPLAGTHYAMSRVKTAYRKTTKDLKGTEKSLKNYFKKIGKIVKENQDNIYRLDRLDPKYLEINA